MLLPNDCRYAIVKQSQLLSLMPDQPLKQVCYDRRESIKARPVPPAELELAHGFAWHGVLDGSERSV
jgi:hypothetical protein